VISTHQNKVTILYQHASEYYFNSKIRNILITTEVTQLQLRVPNLISVEVLLLSILYTKQMFKMSSTSTKTGMDMSDLGMSRHFKGLGVVANVLTDKKMFW